MVGKDLGHYRILERIGAGGIGEVFRARDTRLQRDVALKILHRELADDPERLRRFEREARVLASLNHPNIVTVFSVEQHESLRFIAMELVEGDRLECVIPHLGMAIGPFLDIAVPLADALAAAHDRGVTHRDLKPGNVMVTADGAVKILDFGLAKPAPVLASGSSDQDETSDSTLDGAIVGTVPYMSPEQINGRPADQRSDIFSLGVLFHEMITGDRPFHGETHAELASSILRDSPPPLDRARPDVPPRLARLVERCLARDPDARPQSMPEVRRELSEVRRDADARKTGTPSVAVLPFADMSPEKDQEYFCDGMAEELIGRLAKIRGLHVASRTSAFKYKGSSQDIRKIGRDLEVGAVLEGSVRRSGNQLRITAQLIGVADGYHLWSERYDREMKDVFAIQDEIARRIVDALKVALAPGERASFQEAGTRDVQAYDYYLRGRSFFFQYRRRGIELALRMFSLAIKHDPDYALAFAGIADCHCFMFLYAERRPSSLEHAEVASRKALELCPELAQAHTSRGWALSLSGRHEEAKTEFETAIRLEPTLFEAYYLYARDAFAQGDLEKAAQLFEMAFEVNPDDYQSPLILPQIYVALGWKDKAGESQRRGVRIAEERLKSAPDDVRALYMGANGLVALGSIEKALEWTVLAMSMEPEEPMVLYNVGCIYAMIGRLEEALECLEKAVETGLRQKGWFDHDSNLDSLRSLPRFHRLMERLAEPAS